MTRMGLHPRLDLLYNPNQIRIRNPNRCQLYHHAVRAHEDHFDYQKSFHFGKMRLEIVDRGDADC